LDGFQPCCEGGPKTVPTTSLLADSAHNENVDTVFSPFNKLYQIQVGFFFYASKGVKILLVYKEVFEYDDLLAIVFLCGSKYEKGNLHDKRNVLKNYLEVNISGCHAIILEENFWFRSTNMQYLSYDDIFLKSLAHIEQLASLFANKIIIIHESISTAAELGMFAIDPSLSEKICLLTPDDISIDEKKVSMFIKLAFMNRKSPETRIGKQIIFFPDVYVNRISTEKSDYHTFFHNNEIGQNLGNEILSFVKPTKMKYFIKFNKSSFGKSTATSNQIDYHINIKNEELVVYIHPDALKIQLLSMFFVDEYKKEFRLYKAIKIHVTYICEIYEKLLLSTITSLEGIELHSFKLKVDLKNTFCTLRQSAGYFLYMLQAAKLIGLEQEADSEYSKRRIRLTMTLENYRDQVKPYIYEKKETAFGRLSI